MQHPQETWTYGEDLPPRDGGVARIERLLMRTAILLFTTTGLVFGVWRFIAVLRADLQNPPSGLGAVFFLAAILAGVALLIVLASAAIGFLVGLLLQLAYGLGSRRRLVRPVL